MSEVHRPQAAKFSHKAKFKQNRKIAVIIAENL